MVVPPDSDLPVGFTDGIPVGGEDGPEEDDSFVVDAELRADTRTGRRAVTQRYFGSGPWLAIAVSAANAPRPCTVSNDGLMALMVSPVFKESSAATTPSSAPSPMTLSRADEWTTGIFSTNTNLNSNYGLYENRDPNTAYQQAYWHPGIGIWQYDSAGVGAPYTAIERIDVNIVGADVAKGMINRYCASSSTDGFAKRRAAWQPWGTACTTSNASANLCEIEFQAMMALPRFSNISMVNGIDAAGGSVARSCRIDDVDTACWYIDPALSQGATGWKFNPSGGPDWRTRPTPLSKPFYVVKRNGYEERHWLKADSGYNVDISARRLIGKNARPRSGSVNTGSGLTWTRTSTLCDVTMGRGSCSVTPPPSGPTPPAGITLTPQAVGGIYQPLALDYNGDGIEDILWYAPGTAPDYLWTGRGSGAFDSKPLTIAGNYSYVEILDFDGDGRDDVLWYHPSAGISVIWRSQGNGSFTSIVDVPGRGLQPLILDMDKSGSDEIFWYGPGFLPDALWKWNGSGFNRTSMPVNGVYQPIVGDFDNNNRDDIFWYAPGAAADFVWLFRAAGGYVSVPRPVNGTYRPGVGDFDGDGADDIMWYAPGSAPEYVWFGGPGGNFSSQALTVNDTYDPIYVDLQGDGRTDVLWYSPNGTNDLWTRWSSARGRSSVAISAPKGYRPFVGRFSTGGRDGLFWYGPGSLSDGLWTN
ncbi:MAG: VCBS repeat-containing protein [Aquihabitans sp.]